MKLVKTSEIRPSTYNPRETDPARLDLIELSLGKLGFLLPLYCTPGGEILSGHQRHLVAERMGVQDVPVENVKELPLAERKALNIVFNRATNDFGVEDTPRRATAELEEIDVMQRAEELPDLGVEDFYPCLTARAQPIKPLLEANRGRWVKQANRISRTLMRRGILMPVIVDPVLRVVNGIGRLEMLAEMGRENVEVVELKAEQAEFARAMLNLVSMEFNIHERYADLLRHNSFRRARRVRKCLGQGFTFVVAPRRAANCFDIGNERHRRIWTKEHGRCVIDFGAGHLTETELLRSAGIEVDPFEPYRLGEKSQINKAESVEIARAFLEAVAGGKEWSSIFIASVLNSVPFAQDRRCIIALCAALCTPATKLYAVAQSDNQENWKAVIGAGQLSEKNRSLITFRLDYEPGITLGDFGKAPKVQKYHSREEFGKLFAEFFARVRTSMASHNACVVAAAAKPVDPGVLREAIEFEFDLPYPDGSRMGLVANAKAAFGRRLGVTL